MMHTPSLDVRGRTFLQNLPLLLLCLLLAWSAGFGSRMLDALKWGAPQYQLQGEPLQATHDAYYWLAGARGVGNAQGKPLSRLAKWGGDLLNTPPGVPAFWMPALFAGAAGAITVLLAWSLGLGGAGLVAGVLVVLAPGYYFRTRLGFFDTDMVTLFFPLALVWGVLLAMRSSLAAKWLGKENSQHSPESTNTSTGIWPPLCCILFGLLAKFGASWHGQIETFTLLLLLTAAVLTPVLIRPGRRSHVLFHLTLFAIAAFYAPIGGAVSLLLLAAALWLAPVKRALASPYGAWGAAAMLLLFVLFGPGAHVLGNALDIMGHLSKSAAENTPGGIKYPTVTESITEAQNMDFGALLRHIHPWRWLAALGLIGYFWLAIRRPLALLVLPLLILGGASIYYGGRLAMFAPSVAGLGLAWLLTLLAAPLQHKFPGKTWTNWATAGGALIMALILAVPSLRVFTALPPQPALLQQEAKALQVLDAAAPADATAWIWWDWGYATQYYAGLKTPADGGRFYGRNIFALARALATPSAMASQQIILFSAMHDLKPWTIWDAQSPERVQHFLDSLDQVSYGFAAPERQYVVVTLGYLQVMRWLTYYGTWDVTKGRGIRAGITILDRPFELDENGALHILGVDERPLRLNAAHIARPEGLQSVSYSNAGDLHLLVIPEANQAFIMDALAWNTTAMRLLFGPAAATKTAAQHDLDGHFRLVYDGFPYARVWEVVQKTAPTNKRQQ